MRAYGFRLFVTTWLLIWSLTVSAVQLPVQGQVSTAHPLATSVGVRVLEQGGNAVDAAIAITAALAVVEPYGSGIGGGGFYLIRLHGDPVQYLFLDAREVAPLAATVDMYLDNGKVQPQASLNGALAAAIPGIPAALDALQQHGSLSLAHNLQPAIELAEHGIVVDEVYRQRAGWRLAAMQQDTHTSQIFLADGQLPQADWILRQPQLAATLRLLAEQGGRAFYQGELAQLLVDGVRAAGGIWQLADLQQYQVRWREPLQVALANGQLLVSAPPPSAGGVTLAQALLMLEQLPWQQASGAQRVHLVVEVMRRAYRDRALLGDPDFVSNPLAQLLDSSQIQNLLASIDSDKASQSLELGEFVPVHEGEQTTHFAVLDQYGNAVAGTLSLNMMFGAAFTVPETGVLLNDQMDDFAADIGASNAYGLVGSAANQIMAGKRPLSSMSPSLLESAEEMAAFGTPGGSRIPSMNLLAMLSYLQGEAPQQWVATPRYHHQFLPDELGVEPQALTENELAELEQMGHRIKTLGRNYGNQQVLYWNKRSGHSDSASDPRGQGVSLPATAKP